MMTPLPDSEPYRPPEPPCLVRRVQIRNYKSIRHVDVSLRPLTILVGRNGSGKSNFLDALHFITDSLRTSIGQAIQARGGPRAVFRRIKGASASLSISLTISLPSGRRAKFKLVLLRRRDSFVVQRESLLVRSEEDFKSYLVRKGVVIRFPLENPPLASDERLYLGSASGFYPFGEVYNALTLMGFYNLNPDAMRELQSPDAGKRLNRDGSNIASVIRRLRRNDPDTMARLQSYLAVIAPGVEEVRAISLGPRETLSFMQRVAEVPTKFYATSMSDGTLRAAGVLAAITQISEGKKPLTLVGIEEPETSLHPAASGALMDALREAATHTQIIVTSHSPDLLDQVDLDSDRLLAVAHEHGTTRIAFLDKASRQAIREQLYTPGELLRLDQLEPDSFDAAV